jgi:hypothetical protein
VNTASRKTVYFETIEEDQVGRQCASMVRSRKSARQKVGTWRPEVTVERAKREQKSLLLKLFRLAKRVLFVMSPGGESAAPESRSKVDRVATFVKIVSVR